MMDSFGISNLEMMRIALNATPKLLKEKVKGKDLISLYKTIPSGMSQWVVRADNEIERLFSKKIKAGKDNICHNTHGPAGETERAGQM